ncbi:hypothetical protein AB0J81_28835 [Streptomyces bobili]|uniref:hypothetical protein n=1 Tax=Streptomyces bobili TaxID=67280 RepID=UPI0033CB949E
MATSLRPTVHDAGGTPAGGVAQEIAPGVTVEGPVPEPAEEVRALQRRSHAASAGPERP